VSAYPIEANHGAWWLITRSGWNRLHAVPGGDLTPEQLHEAIDWGDPLIRRVACGPELSLAYPGLGSRFGMPRCVHCCATLGVPQGNGTPVNEAAEKRLAASAGLKE
jgi:hypothetical protein